MKRSISTSLPEAVGVLPKFSRVDVLLNPKSTNASAAKERIVQLRRLYGDKVTVIETSKAGREVTLKALRARAKRWTDRTLVCVAAGDGTVGMVVELLVATGKDGLNDVARQAVLLPIWGGNANDLAHMLGGSPEGKTIEGVLRDSEIVDIAPLAARVIKGKDVAHYIAACYVTCGASGYTAQRINERQFRANAATYPGIFRRVYEFWHVGQLVRDAKPFHYRQGRRVRRAYELVIANGSRMAKLEGFPVRLRDRAFYVDRLSHKRLGAVLSKMVQLLRGGRRYGRQVRPVAIEFLDSTWVQFDGEPTKLKAGTHMRVALHDRSFRALASRH
jgi:diacylglycerol kinase family enzyme